MVWDIFRKKKKFPSSLALLREVGYLSTLLKELVWTGFVYVLRMLRFFLGTVCKVTSARGETDILATRTAAVGKMGRFMRLWRGGVWATARLVTGAGRLAFDFGGVGKWKTGGSRDQRGWLTFSSNKQ
jgi:hypothetical protein